MDFEIKEYIMPNEDYVERIGGYVNSSTWAWTVDYPLCAQRLQNILYGKTNIVLAQDRVSPLDSVSNRRDKTTDGSSDNSSSGDYSNDDNDNNYVEPETPEPVTEQPTYEPEEPATEEPAPDEPEEPTAAEEEDHSRFTLFDRNNDE